MKPQDTVTDWAAMLSDLLEGVNQSRAALSRKLGGYMVSDRLLKAYQNGVQPLHWRGEAIIAAWIEETGRTRSDLPTTKLIRGHRVARRPADRAPVLNALPNWPPAVAPSVKTIKRKQRNAEMV